MEQQQIKIYDLDISDNQKAVLASLVNGKKLADIAVALGLAYSTTSQYMLMWQARGWIRKHKSVSGKIFFILNKETIKL